MMLLVALCIFALANGCFLQYQEGETHLYHYTSETDVETSAFHNGVPSIQAQQYGVHMQMEVTLLHRDTDTGNLHFELSVEGAQWEERNPGRLDNVVEQFLETPGAPSRAQLDRQFTQGLNQFPMYFVQTCNGEIVEVLFGERESKRAVDLKRAFLRTISRRMSSDMSDDHVEAHPDHHGHREIAYSYKRSAVDGATEVTTAHDSVREHKVEMYDAAATKTTRIASRMGDVMLARYHDGVLHHVQHSYNMEYPYTNHSAKSSFSKENLYDHDGYDRTESIDAASNHHLTNMGSGEATVRLVRSSPRVTVAEKREALSNAGGHPTGTPVTVETAEAAIDHKAKYTSRAGDESIILHNDGVDMILETMTFEEVVANLEHGDKAHGNAALRSLLVQKSAETLAAVHDYLMSAERQTVPARQTMINSLAVCGTPECQALLVTVFTDDSGLTTGGNREHAMYALKYIQRPTAETIDAVLAFLPAIERVVRMPAFGHQATLVLGILAEKCYESGMIEASLDLRAELLARMAVLDGSHPAVLGGVLNAGEHPAEHENELLKRIIRKGGVNFVRKIMLDEDGKLRRDFTKAPREGGAAPAPAPANGGDDYDFVDDLPNPVGANDDREEKLAQLNADRENAHFLFEEAEEAAREALGNRKRNLVKRAACRLTQAEVNRPGETVSTKLPSRFYGAVAAGTATGRCFDTEQAAHVGGYIAFKHATFGGCGEQFCGVRRMNEVGCVGDLRNNVFNVGYCAPASSAIYCPPNTGKKILQGTKGDCPTDSYLCCVPDTCNGLPCDAPLDASGRPPLDESQTAVSGGARVAPSPSSPVPAPGQPAPTPRPTSRGPVSFCNPLPADFESYEACVLHLSEQGELGMADSSFDYAGFTTAYKAFLLTNKCGDLEGMDERVDSTGGIVPTGTCGRNQDFWTVAPRNQTADEARDYPSWNQNYNQWKLGGKLAHAKITAVVDSRTKIPKSSSEFNNELFVGAVIDAVVFERITYSVASAWLRLAYVTAVEQGPSLTEDECKVETYELYYRYAGKIFWSQATTSTLQGCVPVFQTCIPNEHPLDFNEPRCQNGAGEVEVVTNTSPDDAEPVAEVVAETNIATTTSSQSNPERCAQIRELTDDTTAATSTAPAITQEEKDFYADAGYYQACGPENQEDAVAGKGEVKEESLCEGINCGDGGDCREGLCVCHNGFYGKFCQSTYPAVNEFKKCGFANYEVLFFRAGYDPTRDDESSGVGRLDIGAVQLDFSLEGWGSTNLKMAPPIFLVSQYEGGTMLNSYIQPEGKVILRIRGQISFSVSNDINFEVFGHEVDVADILNNLVIVLTCDLEIISLKFPASVGLNTQTELGCGQVGMTTSAGGGKFTATVIYKGLRSEFELFKWKGAEADFFPWQSSCCKYCDISCFDNSFCDFSRGQCQCAYGWDGPSCSIPCPTNSDCQGGGDNPNVQVGVECFPVSEPHAPRCRCLPGYHGADCSLECPPTAANYCSGHGECGSGTGGLCECHPHYYGPLCDKTCPETPNCAGECLEARCGLNGYCFFDGVRAKCECYHGYIGSDCTKACPRSDDPRLYICSLQGECTILWTTDEEYCLCNIGFYGPTCESVDTTGSGHALYLPGQPDAQVSWLLRDEFRKIDYDLTHMFWMSAEIFPESGAVATLLNYRYVKIELRSDGKIACCDGADDDSHCAVSASPITLNKWTHIVCVKEGEMADATASRVLTVDGGAPATNGNGFIPIETDYLEMGAGFLGKIDTLAIVKGVLTDERLALFRDTSVSADTPELRFYCLFDAGRGRHEYAERPFLFGRFTGQVTWGASEIQVDDATVNSATVPIVPYSAAAGTWADGVEADYVMNLDGRRVHGAEMQFFMNTTDNSASCPITIKIGDNVVAVAQAQYEHGLHVVPFSAAGVKWVGDAGNLVSWVFSESAPPACRGTDEAPGAIINSFLSVKVEAVDGSVQFAAISTGSIEYEGSLTAVKDSFSIEFWAILDPAQPSFDGVFASMVTKATDVNTVPDDTNAPFRFHVHGGSDRGIRLQSGASNQQIMPFFDLQQLGKLGKWTHFLFSREKSTSSCTIRYYLDGINIVDPSINDPSFGLPTAGCTSEVGGFASTHKLRIGQKVDGELNDFIIHNMAFTSSGAVQQHMNLVKPWSSGQSSWIVGFNFDETEALTFLTKGSAGGTATGEYGVFRSMITGTRHRFKQCPGTSYKYPERVCNNDANIERGVCKSREGAATYTCDCNNGFGGEGCELECPGGYDNPCNGPLRGACIDVENIEQGTTDVACACRFPPADNTIAELGALTGYTGDACQFLCPGFKDPRNLNKVVCSGAGECRVREDGQGAECVCEASANRQGSYCQYEQGKLPIIEGGLGCGACDGPNMECNREEEVCLCAPGTYRVGEACLGPNAAAGLGLAPLATVAAVLVAAAFH
jgi:hypothetical protein